MSHIPTKGKYNGPLGDRSPSDPVPHDPVSGAKTTRHPVAHVVKTPPILPPNVVPIDSAATGTIPRPAPSLTPPKNWIHRVDKTNCKGRAGTPLKWHNTYRHIV